MLLSIFFCALTLQGTAKAQNVVMPSIKTDAVNRAGIDTQKTAKLSLQDAVKMALQNNRDIEIERIKVEQNEFSVQAARGAYDPVFGSHLTYGRSSTPVASALAGVQEGRLRESELSSGVKLMQKLPWGGGTIEGTFDHGRTTSDNLFLAINPQYATSLEFKITQPLFRNRAIDNERRQIRVANKQLNMSDSQFRQKVIEIISQVQRAYWDLVFAQRDHDIKRDSVELARAQLEHNQRLVEKGTLAPLEVVSARVEVERRTDEAEAALEAIQRTENTLKSLLVAPGSSEFWDSSLMPTDQPLIDTDQPMQFEEAMRLALSNRPEMEQYRLRGEINAIDVEYYRNQTKPQVDLIASYGTIGLAGSERTVTNPLFESNNALFSRVNQLSSIAGLSALPPIALAPTPDKFIGGYGQSLSNLFGNEFRVWQFGITINFSIGNRTAKANLGYALAEGKQIDAERQRTKHSIEVEVRNALQAVETARRRFNAARNSRVDAELQLTGEQRKFDGGLSTNFLILDRQNALSSARGREIKALTDYNKAVIELQRSLSITLSTNNIAVASR
jgi:HAE1 family hydrophobic/amphiphilic exporter-1